MSLSAKIAAVEFDDREIRVAVVRTGGKLPVVLETYHARAEFEDPENRTDALIEAATELVQSVKTPVSAWILCADSQYGIVRTLRIPFKGKRKVAAVVPGELEPTLAMPLDDLIVDHSIVREVDGETQVLAIALRRSILEEQINVMRAAGAQIEGISLDIGALASLWRAMRRHVNGLEALLHVDEKGARFVVVYNKSLAWFRNLPVTASSLRQEPEKAVRDVVNSIRAFLANWEGEDEINALTVSGASIGEDARAAFAEGLSFPVSFEYLIGDIKGLDNAAEQAPLPEPGVLDDEEHFWAEPAQPGEAYTALVGAALSVSGGAYNYDFMAPEFRAGVSGRSLVSHAVFSSILAFLAAAGYGAYCYADYTQNVREVDRIGEEIWSIYHENFPNSDFQERPDNDIGGRESIKILEAEAASLDEVTSKVPMDWLAKPRFLDVLKTVSSCFADESVRIVNISISAGRQPTLQIYGEVQGNELKVYQNALEKLKESSTVFSDAVGRLDSDGDKMRFTITASY